jgi:hypothetical protein
MLIRMREILDLSKAWNCGLLYVFGGFVLVDILASLLERFPDTFRTWPVKPISRALQKSAVPMKRAELNLSLHC